MPSEEPSEEPSEATTPAYAAQPTLVARHLTLVAAVGRNRVIGVGGALPWRIPEDMRRFKALTMGGALVMGRRTYDSIGRPLPGRQTVVVTRQPTWASDGVDVAHSMVDALGLVESGREVFVVGGGDIYTLALPLADRLELTEVDQAPVGDAYFPAFSPPDWVTTNREQHEGFAWVTYERVVGGTSDQATNGVMGQSEDMTNDTTPPVPSPADMPGAGVPRSAVPVHDVPDLQADTETSDIPNPETGVGIGAGEASTFEPEETPEQTAGEPEDPSTPGMSG